MSNGKLHFMARQISALRASGVVYDRERESEVVVQAVNLKKSTYCFVKIGKF